MSTADINGSTADICGHQARKLPADPNANANPNPNSTDPKLY